VLAGKDMDQLRTLTESLGVVEHTTFLERVVSSEEEETSQVSSSSMIHLYRSMDACVFPSIIETHNHINIKAMASGLPVISTNGIGVKDTVIDGVDGILDEVGDPF
jgi:glycosyltransferase involved in cell wall biosynthesis